MPVDKFAAIEAARQARDPRDITALRPLVPVAAREREVEPDGKRFRFTFPGERPVPSVTPRRHKLSNDQRKLRKSEKDATRWAERRAAKVCGRCGEYAAANGKAHCQRCLCRAAELERGYYGVGGRERQLAKRAARRENG